MSVSGGKFPTDSWADNHPIPAKGRIEASLPGIQTGLYLESCEFTSFISITTALDKVLTILSLRL